MSLTLFGTQTRAYAYIIIYAIKLSGILIDFRPVFMVQQADYILSLCVFSRINFVDGKKRTEQLYQSYKYS